MLAIRLSRVGKKNFPFFRVVAMDKRKSAKGRALEVLGSVNPRNKDVVLKTERIQYWLGVGAEASDRVYNILVSQKIIEGKKRPKKIRAKKKEEKEAEAAPAAVTGVDATQGAKLEAGENTIPEAKSQEPKEEKAEDKSKEKKEEVADPSTNAQDDKKKEEKAEGIKPKEPKKESKEKEASKKEEKK